MSDNPRRWLVIQKRDDTEGEWLEISKATALKTKKQMIHMDQLPDGTWRLVWTEGIIPDMSVLKGFFIAREG